MSQEKARYPTLPVNSAPTTDYSDHVGTFAIQMACVHNAFIRCLNSMFYNATRLKKGDEMSFVGYCLILVEVIHSHHSIEEEIIFPAFSSALDMKVNVDQHRIFHKGLDDMEAYLKDVESGKETYDGEKIVQLLNAFTDDLVQHLNDEVGTLTRH